MKSVNIIFKLTTFVCISTWFVSSSLNIIFKKRSLYKMYVQYEFSLK